MKKIGILTFQYADNYGAVLQCYALRRTINNLPDCSAEIINYRPPLFVYGRCWNNSYERKLFQNKRKKFERFLKEECGIKDEIIAHVKGSEYDCYCVGSDQIWNTKGDVREFFLPDVSEEIPKIAYAPSIGLDVGSPYLKKDLFRQYLPRFSSLSVREQEHVPLIQELTGKACKCVLDPTLLLKASDYSMIVNPNRIKDIPFLFFFWLQHDSNLIRGIEFANVLSRKFDIPVVHSIIGAKEYMFYRNGGCMMFEGVENFLWYIKNAYFVVTNSYHATLFCIQFESPFYTFVVSSMRSRIHTLVDKIGVGDRIIESYLSEKDVNRIVDFETIQKKIEIERELSMQYLRQALEIV